MALFLPRACLALASVLLAAWSTPAQAADAVKVGSKRFTESYVLGEIARQALELGGVPAEHLQGLGNTAILEQALSNGQIDVYPGYTGTIERELLMRNPPADAPPASASWLARR